MHVDKMLAAGVIQPSISDRASAQFLVRKRIGLSGGVWTTGR